jgi:hypothetical protein
MVDGKAVEEWEVAYELDFLKQLVPANTPKKGRNSFQEMLSSCFDLHFNDPRIYRVSGKTVLDLLLFLWFGYSYPSGRYILVFFIVISVPVKAITFFS